MRYFVFCLDDSDQDGNPGDYVPATHTVFPNKTTAVAYAATVAEGRQAVIIPRDSIFDALKGERFDFSERFENEIASQGIKVRVTLPSGAATIMSWLNFRKTHGATFGPAALLEASKQIALGNLAHLPGPMGDYTIERYQPTEGDSQG